MTFCPDNVVADFAADYQINMAFAWLLCGQEEQALTLLEGRSCRAARYGRGIALIHLGRLDEGCAVLQTLSGEVDETEVDGPLAGPANSYTAAARLSLKALELGKPVHVLAAPLCCAGYAPEVWLTQTEQSDGPAARLFFLERLAATAGTSAEWHEVGQGVVTLIPEMLLAAPERRETLRQLGLRCAAGLEQCGEAAEALRLRAAVTAEAGEAGA